MARHVLVDTGFIVAVLSRRDHHHRWATAQASRHAPPWRTCEAVLSEAFHLLGRSGGPALAELLRRGAVLPVFDLATELRAQHGLKTPDALHLAAALRAGCDEFWTNDEHLAKAAAGRIGIVVFDDK